MNKRCPVIDRPPISSPLTLGVTLTSKGKAMGIASHKLGAVAVALGATAALVLPALQVSASAQEVAIQPRVSGYSWYWSDGAGGTRRTFSQSQYGSASRLPKLVVEGDCTAGARVGDRIKLQWRDSMGRYRTEDTAYVSNCVGRYKLAFYPYDSSGSWAGRRDHSQDPHEGEQEARQRDEGPGHRPEGIPAGLQPGHESRRGPRRRFAARADRHDERRSRRHTWCCAIGSP